MRIVALGDRAFLIEVGASIDEVTHRRVRAVLARLESRAIPGVIEYVPAFASVAVHYDPARVPPWPFGESSSPHTRLAVALSAALEQLDDAPAAPSRTIDVPVCYGGDFGPDLDDVARLHDLLPDEVVRIHASGDYLAYMIGFMPGLAHLGGLDDRIATPRRREPRTNVPASSVGIGGRQTGVYPLVSPGGWNLIGRTPLRMFVANREPASLIGVGDRVRFRAIVRAEFDALDARRLAGA